MQLTRPVGLQGAELMRVGSKEVRLSEAGVFSGAGAEQGFLGRG